MKRGLIVPVLVVLVWACGDSISEPDVPLTPPAPSPGLLDSPPSACYAPSPVRLLADETVPVGSVLVGNDQENVIVVYETSADRPLLKTAVFVGGDPAGIPTTGSGNPRIGRFPHAARHAPGTTRVVWEIPLGGLRGGTATVAAFAEVGPAEDEEGAWAEGLPLSDGRSWATYFTHELRECAVQDVGTSGGTVRTLDGAVTLNIPEGALQETVEISIEPIDVADIGGSGPTLASIESGGTPLVHGVLPIDGTAYRFSPSVEFAEDVEVVIEYDRTKLPTGVDEDRLGVFIVNAFFDVLPTTVDVQAQRLTATTTHFSDYFIGVPTLVDLAVTSLTSSVDPLRYDQPFTLSVEAAAGPDLGPVSDAEVTVTLSGVPLLPGSIPPECSFDGSVDLVSTWICHTGPLDPGDAAGPFDFVFEPFTIGAETASTLSVSAEVAPGSSFGVSDDDPSNDARSLDLPVLAAAAADLRISGVGFSPAVKKAGKEMTVTAIAESRPESPDPVDAGLAIEFQAGAAGIDIPGELLPAGCTVGQGQSFSTVACDLGTLHPGESATRNIVAIPLQAGTRSVSFRVTPEVTDLAPGDNTVGGSYTAETSEVDLAVTIDESNDEILSGQTVVFSSTVESLASSTDPLPRGTLRIEATGDIELFNLSDNCEDVSDVVAFEAAVNCPLPELGPGEAVPDFMGMAVTALSPDQEIEAFARLLLPDYVVDADESDNEATTTTRVRADVEADLILSQFSVSPDPAKANLDLTYTMEVTNAFASADDVTGATLELLIRGSVETGSLPAFCSSSRLTVPAQTTVTCALPELVRGGTQFAFATVRPTTNALGNDLDATATVHLPDGGADPDGTNDSRNLLTPVVSPEMDLFLAPVQESADPIDETETVTYSVQAGNSAGSHSPDAAPEGSVIELRLTGGDATLASASAACEDFSSAGPEPVIVLCSFGPLGPGAVTPVFDVEVAPTGAPQTLEMRVEVKPRTGSTEVDPGDNSAVETTTVEPEAGTTRVWVVNQTGDDVSVVDWTTDAVTATIPVGDNPFAGHLTPDGSELWVGHHTGSVDVVSTATEAATVGAFAVGSNVHDFTFSPDGATAYFTRTSSGAVSVVDAASRTVTDVISGLSFPRGIAVLPNGTRAYVPGSGAIHVLDLTTNTLAGTIPVDGNAFYAVAAPDGSAVYVTQQPSSGAGLVRTVDPTTDALVGPGIEVGFEPYAIELHPGGSEAYVADANGSVWFVDVGAGLVLTSITAPVGLSSRMDLTADGSLLFLTSYSDPGVLTEIDTAARSLTATTGVGAHPSGVAVSR